MLDNAFGDGFADWKGIETRLVVSSGRTGTDFFGNLFNLPEQGVLAFHEPDPDLFDVGISGIRRHDSNEALVRQVRLCRSRQAQRLRNVDASCYVEANPNLVMLLPALEKAFNGPKIAFLTRDIDSYVVSAYNKSPNGSGTMFFYGENDHRKRLTPGDVGSDALAGEWVEEWAGCGRALKIAWWWTYANRQILEHLKTNPSAERFYFEKLFDAGSGEFERLVAFMDFDARAEALFLERFQHEVQNKRNSSARVFGSQFDEFESGERTQILQLTAEVRAELGYPLSS